MISPEVRGGSCQATVAAVTTMNAAIASTRSVLAARLKGAADKAAMAAASFTDQDTAFQPPARGPLVVSSAL